MKRILWLACLVSSPAWAADSLTLDEAVQLALRQSPSVRAAAREVEATEGTVVTANGGFDPMLSVDGGWNRSLNRQRFGQFPDPFFINNDGWDAGMSLSAQAPTGTTASFDMRFRQSTAKIRLDSGDDQSALEAIFGDDQTQKTFQPSFNLVLGQDLLKGIRLKSGLANVRKAKESRTLAELRMAQARQQAVADAARLYWAWVYRTRVVEIERWGVDTAEEALRVGEAKVQAGRAAPVERTRLEAALVQARVQSINAENEAARALDDLLVLLGRTPGEELEPASRPGDVPPLQIDLDEALRDALEGSLDLAVARAQVLAAQAAVADAKHAMLPELQAQINAGLTGFDVNSWNGAFDFMQTLLPNVGVRGTLTVPLGNRAAGGSKQQVSAQLAQAEVEEDRATAQVTASVAAQVRTLRSAYTQVELADANFQLAKETLEAEEARYDAGRSLLQDVLEARAEVQRTAAEAVRARTDFRVAEVELRRLQGRLGDGL